MRWPSGPVEISRRQKSEGFTPQTQQTLARWHEPAALELLKDTPVNCLVISWAAGLPEDAQQQKTAAPLVAEANRRKLSVVGWVEGTADHNAAIAAAQPAGLSAVAIQGFKGKPDPLAIAWGDRAGAPWDSAAPVLPITGNVWPGVASRQDSGKSALLQLVTYASARGTSQMAVWVDRNVRSNRLWSIQAAEPAPATQVGGEYGDTEFHVASMPAYAALELTV